MEDNGIKAEYNLKQEFDIFGEKIHFVEKMPRVVLMQIVQMMINVLLKEDPVTGVIEENRLMMEPLIIWHMVDLLSDMDTKKITESENSPLLDLYDEFNKYEIYELPFFYEIMGNYQSCREAEIRASQDRNAVGAQLRVLAKYGLGTDSSKDIGLIRRVFTDLLLKSRRSEPQMPGTIASMVEEKEEKKNEDPVKDNVVDLSVYKVRKDKGGKK